MRFCLTVSGEGAPKGWPAARGGYGESGGPLAPTADTLLFFGGSPIRRRSQCTTSIHLPAEVSSTISEIFLLPLLIRHGTTLHHLGERTTIRQNRLKLWG